MTVKDCRSNGRHHSHHNPHNHRQVTVDRYGELDQKIDKLSDMTSKMATSSAISPSKIHTYIREDEEVKYQHGGILQFRHSSYTRVRYNDGLPLDKTLEETTSKIVTEIIIEEGDTN